MLSYYQKLFRYDHWANRELVESMERETPPPKALQLMAHVIAAEILWQSRLMKRAAPVSVWPEWDVAEARRHLDRLPALWTEFWNRTPAAGLDGSIRYTNSKGEEWTSKVDDVIDHVLFHSTYHRGQIAAELRKAGRSVPYTDYIHATRQKLIE